MKRFAARRMFLVHFIAVIGLVVCACSLPNLEPAECSEARVAARNFYSFHFANEMKFSHENLVHRAAYLTPEYYASLQSNDSEADVFTSGSDDLPKAFRVGECRPLDASRVELQILLFWRDDVRSEQRPIHVEMQKRGQDWLLAKIHEE